MAETFAVKQAEVFKNCDYDFHQTVNKSHRRIETRCCRVLEAPGLRPNDGRVRRSPRKPTTTFPAYPPMRGPCATTGALRTACTGSTWSSRKTRAASAASHVAHHMTNLLRMALNLRRHEITAQGGIAARRKQTDWNDGCLLRAGQTQSRAGRVNRAGAGRCP